MPPFAAVVFDLYETLVYNNATLWTQTFEEVCREQELPLSGQELFTRWRSLEAQFRRQRLNLLHPDQSPPFQTYEEAWRSCFERVFTDLGRGDASSAARRSVQALGCRDAYPDAAIALGRLRNVPGLRLGLLSNADNAYLEPLLQRHGWQFDSVLSSESARAYKPHPTGFRRILGMLGIEATEALFVGDSQFDDVQGARGVGVPVAWLNRRGAPPDPSLPPPDYEVKSLLEVLPLLGLAEGTPSALSRKGSGEG
ncbi:MAG: HAD family hydrolase [Chloroflexi bacterium]|nr:HAD family hydrolase [Chloroflexota bacterium]